MNDDDHVPESASESGSAADARDEHVAALLAVEPLDELTRRRLVRNALEAAPATRPAHVASRGGRARLPPRSRQSSSPRSVLTGGGSGDQTTAARARDGRLGDDPAGDELPATPPRRTTCRRRARATRPRTRTRTRRASYRRQAARSPASLGDLGDVTAPAALRSRAGTALRGLRNEFSVLSPATTKDDAGVDASRRPAAAAAPNGTGTTTGTAGGTIACSKALAKAQPGLGPVLAIGSATVHGKPATVVDRHGRIGFHGRRRDHRRGLQGRQARHRLPLKPL